MWMCDWVTKATPRNPDDTVAIPIRIGGEAITLEPEKASIRRAVSCAYLLGGFRLVAELVAQVAAWQQATHQAENLEWLRIDSMRQASERWKDKTDWWQALHEGETEKRRLQQAQAEAERICDLIRAAWADIATAEEEALFEYEAEAISEFSALIARAKTLVEEEWKRYAPCDCTDDARKPLSIEDGAKLGASKLCLTLHGDALINAIFQLRRAATDYTGALEYLKWLDGLLQHRNPITSDRHRPSQAKDMKNQARDEVWRAMQRLEETRARIGKKHPLALQVYGRLSTTRKWLRQSLLSRKDLRHVEELAIGAMLEAHDAAPKMEAEMRARQIFRPDTVLRRLPQEIAAAVNSLEEPEQYAISFNLVWPASRAVALRLREVGNRYNSAWLVYAVRHRLRERGLGLSSMQGICTQRDPMLEPYFAPGHLHQAALAEVFEDYREMQEHEQKVRERFLMVVDALAIPAAFFLGPEAVLLLGLVHASVRAQEMGVLVEDYFSAETLARLSFTPIGECVWEHPSIALLVSRLVEDGLDAAGNVATGRLGTALAAIQTVLAIRYGAEAVELWATTDDPFAA